MQKTDKDFRLSEDEMRTYGYKVIDAIVNHFSTQEEKSPINLATRKEMDDLFWNKLQNALRHLKKYLISF